MPIIVKKDLVPIAEDEGKKPYEKWGDDVCRMKQGEGTNRPVKFDYSFVKIAANLMAAGFTYADLGSALGVCKDTIKTWQTYYPQFGAAMKAGKKIATQHLVASGLRAAWGYDYEQRNIYYDKSGKLLRTTVQHKHEPVNDRMLIFMLCNMDKTWKSVHKVEVEGRSFHLNLTGKLEKDAIAAFAGKLSERYGKQIESEERPALAGHVEIEEQKETEENGDIKTDV